MKEILKWNTPQLVVQPKYGNSNKNYLKKLGQYPSDNPEEVIIQHLSDQVGARFTDFTAHVYIYMCVCMYVSMYVLHMYIHVCICMYVWRAHGLDPRNSYISHIISY